MTMTIYRVQGKVPVTVLGLQGDFDASNYQEVIKTAKDIFDEGARDLLFDMSEITFMSSSGLVALHSMALLMHGESTKDPEVSFVTFHSLDRKRDIDLKRHFKLLSPQSQVKRALEISGLEKSFDIHNGLGTAINSFK